MIIIERSYEIPNSCGGPRLHTVDRKVFADDDISGVQAFLDERSSLSGY